MWTEYEETLLAEMRSRAVGGEIRRSDLLESFEVASVSMFTMMMGDVSPSEIRSMKETIFEYGDFTNYLNFLGLQEVRDD